MSVDQKNAAKEDLQVQKAKDGQDRCTHGQMTCDDALSSGSVSSMVGLVSKSTDTVSHRTDLPSCTMTVSDNNAFVEITGRCDYGSDESIASPKLAEQAVLNGIGRINAIPAVSVKVALTKEKEAPKFTFSRSWTVPARSYICRPVGSRFRISRSSWPMVR